MSALSPAASSTTENVDAYRYPGLQGLFPAERRLFARWIRPQSRVLDIGCGLGRVAHVLAESGHAVVACDLNAAPLPELRRAAMARIAFPVLRCDGRDLPFAPRAFNAVLFPANGIDYINPDSERRRCLADMARCLAPDGVLLFSTHNPVGTVFSPRGLASWNSWRFRARYVLTGGMRGTHFTDPSGLWLAQKTPAAVAREVEAATGLALLEIVPRSGLPMGQLGATLLSCYPHYVFGPPGRTVVA